MFKPKMCLKEVFCCRWLCTLQSECGQAFVSPHRGHWHNTHRQTIRLQNYPAPRSPPSGRVCERKSVSGDSPPKTAASTAKLRCCHTPHLWVLPGSTSASDSLFFLWGKVEEDFSLSKNQELLPQSFSVEERCLSPSIILFEGMQYSNALVLHVIRHLAMQYSTANNRQFFSLMAELRMHFYVFVWQTILDTTYATDAMSTPKPVTWVMESDILSQETSRAVMLVYLLLFLHGLFQKLPSAQLPL